MTAYAPRHARRRRPWYVGRVFAAALLLTLASGCVTVQPEPRETPATLDERFLAALAEQDITSPLDIDEVALAHDVCDQIDLHGGVSEFISYVIWSAPDASQEDLDFVAQFAGVAVAYYCPEVTAL